MALKIESKHECEDEKRNEEILSDMIAVSLLTIPNYLRDS